MWADPGAPTRCLRLSVPAPRPVAGPWPALGLSDAAAARGLDTCPWPPDLSGTPDERRAFLRRFLERRGGVELVAGEHTDDRHAVVRARSRVEGQLLKRLIWSLGGVAMCWDDGAPGPEVQFALPVDAGLPERLVGRIPGGRITITGVEPLHRRMAMTCIRTDRPDGLYVVDGHIVTHNTELLLGLVSQALMWSSGFIFCDGKGTRAFYSRVWSLAKRSGGKMT